MRRRVTVPLPRHWPRLIRQGLLAAIGLERMALLDVRSGFEQSADPRAAHIAEIDRLREQLTLAAEETRILRARLAHVSPSKRPHYPPAERLAILELRSKLGLNAAETARRFQLTPKTIASWLDRLDEHGHDALVRTPVPINRYPDFVAHVVQKLHYVAPCLGRRKLAELFARAGLHLAASTIERLTKRARPSATPPHPSRPLAPPPDRAHSPTRSTPLRIVRARFPHHVWHIDLTVIPSVGFWVWWWPFSLFTLWPVCWSVAVILDHYSRAVIAAAVFQREPTAKDLTALLDDAVERAGRAPRYTVTDQGSQFRTEFRDWCRRHGATPRFGAIGQHGSIAVIERFIRTMKDECFRRILVPLSTTAMVHELSLWVRWYNDHRPHSTLGGATPSEIRNGSLPARARPALEVRRGYPLARGDPPALRRRCVEPLELDVHHLDGRSHLPIIELHRAA